MICNEGQASDRIFVLVAGKAEVTRQVDGEAKTLAFLGGGSIFGEISMLTGAAPTSTITAVSDCDLLEIEREDLNQIARTFPSVPAVLATFAQQRMARNLIATSPLFALVPEAERRRAADPLRLQGAGRRARRRSAKASRCTAWCWCWPASWWCRRKTPRAG